MSKTIPITQGQRAIVDNADYKWLNQQKWHANKTSIGTFCATRKGRFPDGLRHNILMHREIMGLSYGDKLLVDHINHNPLDNRRCNLRICSHKENLRNRRKVKGTSQYKGVCWSKRVKMWKAQIRVDDHLFGLGYFKVERDAAQAYDMAAKKYFKEFAHINIYREENK